MRLSVIVECYLYQPSKGFGSSSFQLFKPTIFDRIDFIKEQIEEKFETERKVKTVK